jgi:hypothetical protein
VLVWEWEEVGVCEWVAMKWFGWLGVAPLSKVTD